MDLNYQIIGEVPSVADYQTLRRSAGWACTSDEVAGCGLARSLFSVCAVYQGNTIGCGRIVGDGHIYFYVQDVIVSPEHQGKNIGRRMMQALMKWLGQHAGRNAFIGLMAAGDVAGFYESYGFLRRPDNAPGMYLPREK